MSDPTSTPVDRSHEAPIRDEIRRVNHAIESLQKSFGPLFDALSDRLSHRLDAFFEETEASRREDAAAVKLLIEQAEERNDAAILAAHLHFSKEIKRVDGRVDGMGQRVSAVEEAIGEKDAIDIVVRDAIANVDKRVDEHESFLSRYRQPIAASAGSTGLTLAVIHLAPLLWELFKSKAGIP